jgi:hypothetical protein
MSHALSILSAVVSAAFLTVSAALAQDLTDADRDSIVARIAALDEVMLGGDMAAIIDLMPARILSHMAEKSGASVEDVRAATTREIEAAMEAVKIEDFEMDFAKATFATTPDGTHPYALIPTTTVMTMEGTGKIEATSQTLALRDEGTWYLVRIEGAAQDALVKGAYPEFEGVDFPQGDMELVE